MPIGSGIVLVLQRSEMETVGIPTEVLNDVGAEIVATVLTSGVHRHGEVASART